MPFHRDFAGFSLTLTLLAAAAGTATAQDSAAAATAERPLTSGVYSSKQVERGEGVYRTSCQSCHAKTEYTGDKFKVAWVTKTAFDIFNQVRSEMPEDNPGSLERQEYVDVIAYIFSLNAYPAGANELPGDDDGLKKIRIDNPPTSMASTASRAMPRGTAHPRVTFRK
jgi:mono/diheme cytochrome c family protein